MANTRTGSARGYRGQKGGAHTLPWREDREILVRIAQGRRLRSQGLNYPEIALRLGVAIETVSDDARRDRELAAESVVDAREEHITNLRELWRMTHDLLEQTGNQSLNKSALVGQLRQIESDIAKLDGSLVERSMVEATLHNGDRDLELLRPEARERLNALYSALDDDTEPIDAGEGSGRTILALPAPSPPDRTSPARSGRGA